MGSEDERPRERRLEAAHALLSILARALLTELPERNIEIGMMFRKVRDAVMAETKNEQEPHFYGSLSGVPFFLAGSDLNVASIAIGALAGVQTVRRTVTNVGGGLATYAASVTGMAGFTVAVTPAVLTLGPGASGSFTVTITRTTATLNTYSGGQLRWTDGIHTVRSPMVVRPVANSEQAISLRALFLAPPTETRPWSGVLRGPSAVNRKASIRPTLTPAGPQVVEVRAERPSRPV